MIAIVGATHDDILYFESIASNRRKEEILGHYQVSIGTVFNQEVIIVDNLHTSILASAIITDIINKYYINLIIVVGKCSSISNGLKCGDVVISSRIINANVDQIGVKNVVVGQIPTLPRDFPTQMDVINYLVDGLNKRTYAKPNIATFLSSDNQLDFVKDIKGIFGLEGLLVMDSNSGGVAVACHLHDIPCVSIKVVEKVIGAESKVDHYLKVLDQYVAIGKAVTSTIGDIGRNDILKGRTIYE